MTIWESVRKRVMERLGWISQMTEVLNESGDSDTVTYMARERQYQERKDSFNEAINSEWFADFEARWMDRIKEAHLAIIAQLPFVNDPKVFGEVMKHRQTIEVIKEELKQLYELARQENDDVRYDLLDQQIKEAELNIHTIPR